MIAASSPAGLDLAQAVAGLPVAVVVIFLALSAWRLNATGKLITGREHREIIAQVEARAAVADDRADTAAKDARYWQGIALRALNVGEAALGRQHGGTG